MQDKGQTTACITHFSNEFIYETAVRCKQVDVPPGENWEIPHSVGLNSTLAKVTQILSVSRLKLADWLSTVCDTDTRNLFCPDNDILAFPSV